MKTTEKLSLLWIVVLINLLFADILSIMVELVDRNTMDILGEVKTTMAIAAIITNIPILMIFFSRSLEPRKSYVFNIIASCITMVFVIGGGSLLPHYIVCGTIEVIVLLFIIRMAWRGLRSFD